MSYIRQSDLRGYALGTPVFESAHSIKEAKNQRRTTIFLSHSHRDHEIARGLKNKLKNQNVEIYIDWEDTSMPDEPNKETAQKIQTKIIDCDILLFLATQNSMTSKWCPWEIGFADGKKIHETIIIVPTQDDSNKYYGNEYLQLYNHLEIADTLQKAGVFAPRESRGPLFEDYARKYAK